MFCQPAFSTGTSFKGAFTCATKIVWNRSQLRLKFWILMESSCSVGNQQIYCYSKYQWNGASLCNTNISRKGHQKNIFTAKVISNNRFLIVWNYLLCSKIHFLFYETKVLFVNCLKWHYKLQCLFCGALYNQWKCKKRTLPLFNFYCIFSLVLRLFDA